MFFSVKFSKIVVFIFPKPFIFSAPNKGCDPGWLKFGGHCYYFERKAQLSWHDAERKCIGDGGHLVSLHNADENEFVKGETL